MADGPDWLDGYTLEELLGALPVSKTKKQLKTEKKYERKAAGKRGPVSAVVGAPFRLLIGLIKLPITLLGGLLKLPVRLLGLLTRPFRSSKKT